jgi:hypothetical protein
VRPYYKLRNVYEGTAGTSGGTQCDRECHFHAELSF